MLLLPTRSLFPRSLLRYPFQLSKTITTSTTPIANLNAKSTETTTDPITHTGQSFPPSDPRLARFTDKPKQINPRFAIDLISAVPPQEAKSSIVSCDGGGGPLGHPKVYINLDQPGNHSCGYCGLRFYK